MRLDSLGTPTARTSVGASAQSVALGGASKMIASSAVAITAPTDTVNNVLATVVVPGGSMGPNGILRVTIWASMSGTANKTLRIRYGGTTLGLHTLSTSVLTQSQYDIVNRNNEAVQIGQTNSARNFTEFAPGAAFVTGAINSAVDQNLTIELQKVTGADAYVVERYSVEVIRPLA